MLSVLPGTLPVAELTRRLADADAAVVLKLGRSYHNVREALSASGQLDDAFYVERASTPGQRILPAADVDETSVPYFSLAMVPAAADRRTPPPSGRDRRPRPERQRLDDTAEQPRAGRRDRSDRLRPLPEPVPGPRRPAASPQRHRRTRACEARACALAEQDATPSRWSPRRSRRVRNGHRRPGRDRREPMCSIRSIPAMTAAQAVANRVGALLGHDYAMISSVRSGQAVEVIAERSGRRGRRGFWCWPSTSPASLEGEDLAGRRHA